MNTRSSAPSATPEDLRRELEELVRDYEASLKEENLRRRVLGLIPVFHKLRRLGRVLLPVGRAPARQRILHYFRAHPRTVISGDELLVVSGIQEYARRVRELRVQHGWPIVSGVTLSEMRVGDDEEIPDYLRDLRPDQYALLSEEPDLCVARRWTTANAIRKSKGPVRDKLLEFLRAYPGQPISNDELRYVAGNKTEWARRVRELRTEFGWPVVTKTTGRPDLDVGVYVLQADRQSPEHDRRIDDSVRRAAMRRDSHRCTACGWLHNEWNPSDPRHLELHHVEHHGRGGENTLENLTTLCVVCHDAIHRKTR